MYPLHSTLSTSSSSWVKTFRCLFDPFLWFLSHDCFNIVWLTCSSRMMSWSWCTSKEKMVEEVLWKTRNDDDNDDDSRRVSFLFFTDDWLCNSTTRVQYTSFFAFHFAHDIHHDIHHNHRHHNWRHFCWITGNRRKEKPTMSTRTSQNGWNQMSTLFRLSCQTHESTGPLLVQQVCLTNLLSLYLLLFSDPNMEGLSWRWWKKVVVISCVLESVVVVSVSCVKICVEICVGLWDTRHIQETASTTAFRDQHIRQRQSLWQDMHELKINT